MNLIKRQISPLKSTANGALFRYGYLSPALKRPFLTSLLVHSIFIIVVLLHREPPYETTILEVQITNAEIIDDNKNEPDPAAPQQTRETTYDNSNIDIETESLSFRQKENTPVDDQLKESDQFIHEYEDTLFTRSESKQEVVENRGTRTEWQEEEYVAGHAEKTGTAEKVKIPGGATDSSAIQWEGSYARKMTHRPQIDYPRHFRRQGIQGTVVLALDVNAAGEVVHVEIVKSSGHFKLDILAQKAMRKARFSPRPGAGAKNIDKGKVRIYFELAR